MCLVGVVEGLPGEEDSARTWASRRSASEDKAGEATGRGSVLKLSTESSRERSEVALLISLPGDMGGLVVAASGGALKPSTLTNEEDLGMLRGWESSEDSPRLVLLLRPDLQLPLSTALDPPPLEYEPTSPSVVLNATTAPVEAFDVDLRGREGVC